MFKFLTGEDSEKDRFWFDGDPETQSARRLMEKAILEPNRKRYTIGQRTRSAFAQGYTYATGLWASISKYSPVVTRRTFKRIRREMEQAAKRDTPR